MPNITELYIKFEGQETITKGPAKGNKVNKFNVQFRETDKRASNPFDLEFAAAAAAPVEPELTEEEKTALKEKNDKEFLDMMDDPEFKGGKSPIEKE